MMSVFDVLESISKELPGCILTSIINTETGMPLARVTDLDLDDAAGADALHNDLYRLATQAMRRSSGEEQRIDGIVIESQNAIFVSSPLGDTGFMWHVVTDLGTTLGFTQAVMRKSSERMTTAIHELFS